jgi:hypothetical protein
MLIEGQAVTCRKCQRSWALSPMNDYYNATTATDGLCEPCMLAANGLSDAKMYVVIPFEKS